MALHNRLVHGDRNSEPLEEENFLLPSFPQRKTHALTQERARNAACIPDLYSLYRPICHVLGSKAPMSCVDCPPHSRKTVPLRPPFTVPPPLYRDDSWTQVHFSYVICSGERQGQERRKPPRASCAFAHAGFACLITPPMRCSDWPRLSAISATPILNLKKSFLN